MKIKVYLLRAFGIDKDDGNPAGVVLNADNLTDSQKQTIATEVGFSETAFVEGSEKADYKVRFFTPNEEVDLCGHATIATYSLLFQKKLIKSGQYTQELKAGVLKVEIDNQGMVVMNQTLPVFGEEIDATRLAEVCNIDLQLVLSTSLKPQIVSTGLRDILLPVSSREALFNLSPDHKKLTELNKETNSIGLHAFTLDTIDKKAIAHCRNFAPLYDIPEESATGSSNGALACYLFNNDKLQNTQNMLIEQGYSMQKPSHIYVSLEIENGDICRVQVGGTAVLFSKQELDM